ncbi:hypothetical protein [Rhodococcus opacus]|nr:hypothetical protein [Rhodococcus opacus]
MLVTSDLAPRRSRDCLGGPVGALASARELPRLAHHGDVRAVRGNTRLHAYAFRDASTPDVDQSRPMLDAALHSIFDALTVRPIDGDSRLSCHGIVFLIEAGDRPVGIEEMKRLLAEVGAHEILRCAAVGLAVIGGSAAAAAIDIDFLARTVRASGGYVVGTGMVITKRDAATVAGSDGAVEFKDITLASSVSLLGRRVATLAASGRALRAA